MNRLELAEIGLGNFVRWHDLTAPKRPAKPASSPRHAMRTSAVSTQAPAASQPPASTIEIANLDLAGAAKAAATCRQCPLSEQRTQAVFGAGDTAKGGILFVGEGPGAEEDRKGEPFVGPAGRLLNQLLAAIGLAREEKVYITNAVKCRPPNNRTPKDEEVAACKRFLDIQIEQLEPRLIVALGTVAGNALLDGNHLKMYEMRGAEHSFNGIPMLITYHPSYFLHNPIHKIKGWEDFLVIKRMAGTTQATN